MVYRIYEENNLINRIVADEEFCKVWCAENGYTYEAEPEPTLELEPPTDTERLRADVDFLAAMTGVQL